MTPEDCLFVAELCAERAGFAVSPDKAYVIESRLGPLARRESFGSAAELIQSLRARPEERLAIAVAEAMVSGETGFFRDRALIERLWREVVPELARRRPDGVVRLWSAGCGTGQEIYSIAMLQADEPAPTGRVELFASDLSERLLERAQAGLYSSFEVQRGLGARQLVRHFDNRGEQFQVIKRIRQSVRWRRINLLDDLSALGEFDLVLCRNVVRTMTPDAAGRVLEHLSAVIASDGVLVVGRNETVSAPGFAPVEAFDTVYARKRAVRAAA